MNFAHKTAIVLIISLGVEISYSQDLKSLDSLKTVLKSGNINDSLSCLILNRLMQLSTDPNDIILYANKLLDLDLSNIPIRKQSRAHIVIGVANRMQGKLNEAISYMLIGAKIAIDSNIRSLQAEAYLEIGATYSINNDLKNALIYENKAINLFRTLKKKQELAINLLNTGYTYYTLQQYDTALLYYNEAGLLFDSVDLEIGKAYTIGNSALVYWKTGDMPKAKKGLLKAIEMLVPLGDHFGMADYHNQLGNLYLEEGNGKAAYHLQKGLDMALEMDLKEQIRDASLALSKLYSMDKNYAKAFQMHQQYVAYKDNISNNENTQAMADLRTAFEVSLREKEIEALEKDKELQWIYISIAVVFVMLSIVIILYFRQRFITIKLQGEVERTVHHHHVRNLLKTQETEALRAMVKGKEDERKHLAKEIHNHLGNLLATVKVNLNGLEIPDRKRQEHMVALVDKACEDVRNISHELNMGISETFGLVPALKELAMHLEDANGLEVELTVSLNDLYIDADNEILVYRIIQELISNVLKHSKASKLAISLTGFVEDKVINILVQDNGVGMDDGMNSNTSNGMGLSGLHEMVDKLSGDMNMDSSTKSGTTVNIDLPVVLKNENGVP